MTDCPVHGRPTQDVCGVEACGLCYEADMLAEPIRGDMREGPELVRVYSPEAHRMIVKKATRLTTTLAKV